MSIFINRHAVTASGDESETSLNRRIIFTMAVAVAITVIASSIFAPWRTSSGLFLGGVLSLFSYRWMINSIRSAFTKVEPGERPHIGGAKYILRYFVIGFVVYFAYWLNLVSLPATIVGLCSFVVALFVEALREFYFIIVHREELG